MPGTRADVARELGLARIDAVEDAGLRGDADVDRRLESGHADGG